MTRLINSIRSFKDAVEDSLMLSTSLEVTNIMTVILHLTIQSFLIALLIYAIYTN